MENDIFELPEKDKLRRFSLIIGIVLFTYSIAAVKLDVNAVIHPLGIPLKIEYPNIIGIGLVLASVYSTLRYIYYAIIVRICPMEARKLIREGSPLVFEWKLLTSGSESTEHKMTAINRYYPKGLDLSLKNKLMNNQTETYPANIIPLPARLITWLEDVDYFAPVWVNLFAILFWFKFIFGLFLNRK